MKGKDFLLNPFFLLGLFLLILNDLFLKWHFSNMITGKLSDLAGLFILPLVIGVLIPRSKNHICLTIGFLFIIWKSSLSTAFIQSFNALPLFNINRVIDYTDLIALAILPFSHIILQNNKYKNQKTYGYLRCIKVGVFMTACFAFSATSMIRFEIPKGTIYLGKSYTIKLPKDSVVNRITALGYEWRVKTDTISNTDYYNPLPFYQIDNVIIKDGDLILDTLNNIKFTLQDINEHKSKLEIINVELKEPGNIQNWKYLRRLHKFYKNQIKETFIKELKE